MLSLHARAFPTAWSRRRCPSRRGPPDMLLNTLLAILLTGTDGYRIPPPRSIEPLSPRIDALIAAGYEDFVKHAAPRADDAEFVRRITLDLTGTIPTAAETREFLADKNPAKRAKLIAKLLDSPGFIRRMIWFWDVTLMERRGDAKVPHAAWEEFLRAAVTDNRPYDAFVRD